MDDNFIGRRISFGLAKETTRGTTPASATVWVPQLEGSFQDKVTKVLNDSAYGVIDKTNSADVAQQWAEGSINGKIMINTFGHILMAAFGSVSSVPGSGGTAGTFAHTFTRANSNLAPSYSVYVKDPSASNSYARCVLKSLVIEVVTGEYVKYTAEWLGRKGVTSAQTVAYTTVDPEFISKDAVFKLAANTAGLGAATAATVKSVKLTLDRDVEALYELGSVDVAEVHNKSFNVTVEVEKRYKDTTYKNLAFANTPQAASLSLIDTGVVIGSATANPSLVFTLPKVFVTEYERGQGIDDIVTENFSLQGTFDLATSSQISAVLTNVTASY